ncbi:hypothetical protein Q7P37_005640 [Cladosporium fusiforme]
MSRAVSRRPDRDTRSSYDDRYDDRYTDRYDDRYDDERYDERDDERYNDRRRDRYDDRYTERYDDRYTERDDGYSEPAGRKKRNRNASPSAYSDDSYYTRRRSYPPSSRGTRTRKPTKDDQEAKEKDSKFDMGKASFLVGMITVVAGAFQLWTTKKTADREKEERRLRQREFERRKRERRRAEQKEIERRDRQWEWDNQRDAETVSDMRTLTYLPDRQREPSEAPSRAPRLEPPPPEDDVASKTRSTRSRAPKGRTPSRAPSQAPSRAPSRAPSQQPARAPSQAPSDLTRRRSDDSFEPRRDRRRPREPQDDSRLG